MSISGKPLAVHILQWCNMGLLLGAVLIIIVLHAVPTESLLVLRIPIYLREIDPTIGFAWPASMNVYHAFLAFFFFILTVNALGFYYYHSSRWRSLVHFSSFVGLFVSWSMFLFFIFSLSIDQNFGYLNVETAIIYLFVSLILFVIDLITFVEVNKVFSYEKYADWLMKNTINGVVHHKSPKESLAHTTKTIKTSVIKTVSSHKKFVLQKELD